MKKFFFFVLFVVSGFARAGEIEYGFSISKLHVDGSFFLLEDERRGKEFLATISCGQRYFEIRAYDNSSERKELWRYSLKAFLNSNSLECDQFHSNIKLSLADDDFHFTFDAATLSIKRVVATPKNSK